MPIDTDIRIVPADQAPATLAAIRHIAEASWRSAYATILTAEFIAHELVREYSDESLTAQMASAQRFHLALMAASPVGFVSYECLPEPPSLMIHKLYLLPEQQGRGVGARLMQAAEGAAAQAGCDQMLLKVNRYNPAVGFYQRQGFVIAESIDQEVGPGHWRNDYLMVKGL